MLGPQCLNCRRRRVKCDSTQPSCIRCDRDGHGCLGYDSYRWIPVEPTKKAHRQSSRPSRPNRIRPQAGARPQPEEAYEFDAGPPLSLPRYDVHVERRFWHIAESVDYCNSIVLPDVVPYPYARTYTMRHDDWRRAPSLLHSIVLVITYNHRIVRRVSDDSSTTDLYRYRGDTLRELANEIRSPETSSPILALVGVLMVIQAEIQLSAASSWDLHLRAARALIELSGGITKCWHDYPHMRILLSFHFLIETMSPVTTPTSLLSQQELREAEQNIVNHSGIEHSLLASCCPLPLPLLIALTQVNRLRGEIYLHRTKDHPQGTRFWRRLVDERVSVLAQLRKFDPEAWAARIITEFPDEGMFSERAIPSFKQMEMTEWIEIAQCYQSSVMIYALRSTISLTHSAEDTITAETSKSKEHLRAETYTLGTSLDKLFFFFGDRRSSSLRPGLWRFTMFPSFIHALELLAMQESRLSEKVERHYLDRMLSLGQMLGCRTMSSAVACIERALQLKRQRGHAPGWDECFLQRAVFVI